MKLIETLRAQLAQKEQNLVNKVEINNIEVQTLQTKINSLQDNVETLVIQDKFEITSF